MSRYNIGIIGFSGSKVSTHSLSKKLFDDMVYTAEQLITINYNFSWNQVHLISGGAAWGDHVAVILYLKHRDEGVTLTICSPCNWNQNEYFDNKLTSDWRTNPGHLTNNLHHRFSTIIERDTLKDLSTQGISFISYSGFHTRNTAIAENSQLLFAFSWSSSAYPESGGTLDTWNKATNAQKIHISLTNFN